MAARDNPTFTLASFNTRWGYDTANVPFDMAQACRTLDADVIALQEVWEPDEQMGPARAAAQALGYTWEAAPLSASNVRAEPRIVRHAHERDGWWGLALLSRLPVRSVEVVPLSRQGGWVDIAHRQAIVALVEVGDLVVRVINVHLSFVLPMTLRQLANLHRLGLDDRDTPTIVMGDCNLPAFAVGPAFGGWQRAIHGPTFPARRPWLQLDHAYARGLTVTGGEVLPAFGSDHLPIRATLTLPG